MPRTTYTREEWGFNNAQEEAHSDQPLVVVDCSRSGRDTGPSGNAAWKIDARSDTSQDHVGRQLGQHVADIEDGNGHVELVADEAKISFKVVQPCLSGRSVSTHTGCSIWD